MWFEIVIGYIIGSYVLWLFIAGISAPFTKTKKDTDTLFAMVIPGTIFAPIFMPLLLGMFIGGIIKKVFKIK